MPITDTKRTALSTRPKDFDSHLFSAARNLAIEAMLLRLEATMFRQGCDVTAEWRESSRGGPVIWLRLRAAKGAEEPFAAEAALWINRERINVLERQKVSDSYYSLNRVDPMDDSPRRESKRIQTFRDLVRELGSDGGFASEVVKVNYPFDHDPVSSF